MGASSIWYRHDASCDILTGIIISDVYFTMGGYISRHCREVYPKPRRSGEARAELSAGHAAKLGRG